MKVILLKDVARIGRRHQIVTVADGYALNQLIPKQLAQPATPHNLKQIEKFNAETVASQNEEKALFVAAKTSLAAHQPVISTEANEKGHLFKAVSAIAISEAAKNTGITLPVNMIAIKTPIKEVGEHQLELIHDGERSSFTIMVTSNK